MRGAEQAAAGWRKRVGRCAGHDAAERNGKTECAVRLVAVLGQRASVKTRR